MTNCPRWSIIGNRMAGWHKDPPVNRWTVTFKDGKYRAVRATGRNGIIVPATHQIAVAAARRFNDSRVGAR